MPHWCHLPKGGGWHRQGCPHDPRSVAPLLYSFFLPNSSLNRLLLSPGLGGPFTLAQSPLLPPEVIGGDFVLIPATALSPSQTQPSCSSQRFLPQPGSSPVPTPHPAQPQRLSYLAASSSPRTLTQPLPLSRLCLHPACPCPCPALPSLGALSQPWLLPWACLGPHWHSVHSRTRRWLQALSG